MNRRVLRGESPLAANSRRAVIEKIVIVFVLGYGLHYFAYFLRARYYTLIDSLSLSDGLAHTWMYLGHVFFLAVMLLYALAVKRDREYIFCFLKGKALRNLKYALVGAGVGFGMMGICILAASLNGNLEIKPSGSFSIPILLFAVFAVFIQSSVEEIESRGFVFGKMHSEGVPLIPAVLVSSVYFSYLHAANPGFGIIPLISIFLVGVLYALSYHYFGTIWFTCLAHMMWNFTQDFIFGLPDSGKPAAMSVYSTKVNGSGFFYDKDFGIEGSLMAIVVHLVMIFVVILIGRKIRASRQRWS